MTRKLKYPKSVAAVKATHSAKSCSQSLLRFGDLGSYAAGFVSSRRSIRRYKSCTLREIRGHCAQSRYVDFVGHLNEAVDEGNYERH